MKPAFIIVCVFALWATASGQAPPASSDKDMVPLEIKLPKAGVVETPKELPKTLEIPTTRPVFVAPKGTVNLALGRPVTSSDKAPSIGDLKMVTDGDKEAGEGSFIELGPGIQWVQIDLGATCPIWAVAIWHHHAGQRIYKAVIVRVSNDADFINGVTTIFNNDVEDLAGFGQGKDREYLEHYAGKLIESKGIEGRYVRLYSAGSSAMDVNHYVEVEVYGVKK